jgi:hypothetical protein
MLSSSRGFMQVSQAASLTGTPPTYHSVGAMSRGQSATSPNTVTWSHTAPTSSNDVALLFLSIGQAGGTFATTSASFGGVSMTLINSVTTGDGMFAVYGLLNPASGANTASVTYSRTVTSGNVGFLGNSIILNGATGWGSSNTATGVSGTASITSPTIPTGSWVVGAIGGLNITGFSTMTGGTLRFNNGQNINKMGISTDVGAGSTTTFSAGSQAAGLSWGGLTVRVIGT